MKKTLILSAAILAACRPVAQRPPAEEPPIYWVDTSVHPWTSNAAALSSSRYIGITMSAYNTLDPIDVAYLEKLQSSLTLENATGEHVALPVVSTDFSQTFTNTSRFLSPGEIIVDASAASDTGWNIMRLGFPTEAAYDEMARSGEVALPFRFDRAPAIKRIYFPDSDAFRFEIWFTEFVDSGAPNDAFHFSSDGKELKCSASWEGFEPGARITLFVTCDGSLPSALDVELVDGVVTAGDVPVGSVKGTGFAERLTLSDLYVDGFGGRAWVPPSP